MSESLTPAMEDYLELIIKLKRKNKVVRVRDIARGMNVTMPSVTSMLNSLAKKNLIIHAPYDYVELTPWGFKKAQESLYKHNVFVDFLKKILKLDAKQAENDACRMEHAVSPATLKRLVEFIEFITGCLQGYTDFFEYFKTHCRQEVTKEKCEQHLKESLKRFFPGLEFSQEDNGERREEDKKGNNETTSLVAKN
ncbi:MAG: metal-dependent transcriptional regulator [Desulfobacterota bacterium]|nr:metal-dependent transcriptional regulator [Thermodesulfobacteriota bacterium]